MEKVVASLIDPMVMRQKMADMVIYGYDPITWEINYAVGDEIEPPTVAPG